MLILLLCIWLLGKIVCLLDKVNESLSLHKLFEKSSVFLNVLHVVREVENVVRTVSSRAVISESLWTSLMVWIVEILKGVD